MLGCLVLAAGNRYKLVSKSELRLMLLRHCENIVLFRYIVKYGWATNPEMPPKQKKIQRTPASKGQLGLHNRFSAIFIRHSTPITLNKASRALFFQISKALSVQLSCLQHNCEKKPGDISHYLGTKLPFCPFVSPEQNALVRNFFLQILSPTSIKVNMPNYFLGPKR